jgi:hypothetical protein
MWLRCGKVQVVVDKCYYKMYSRKFRGGSKFSARVRAAPAAEELPKQPKSKRKRSRSPRTTHASATWASKAVFQLQDPNLSLHEEIIDFYDFMKDTPEEETLKNEIVDQMVLMAK